jgi:hypothetical protein
MGPSGEPGEIRTCARLPAVVRDRRAIVWACFGPILRISLRGEVKRFRLGSGEESDESSADLRPPWMADLVAAQ